MADVGGSRMRLTARQRRELGARLSGERADDRGAASRLAKELGMSASWMRTLKKRAAAGPPESPPGRPRHSEAERARVRGLVEAERVEQGRSVGSPAILESLRRKKVKVSRMLVEQELAALKEADRTVQRLALEAARVSYEIVARDAVWGEDTTHLARLEDDEKVEAEVVKDLGTLETAGLSVGPVPSALDTLALLERTAEERGGWPLVRMVDQGSINKDARVLARLKQERVVHLLSRVHTPTDNAGTEHQHRELKDESGLGKGVRVASHDVARERLCAARFTLDHGRLRATKDWHTAAELGRVLPRADSLVDREVFYAAACSAMEEAVRGLTKRRAVLRARRGALFATLVRFGLAVRHVGRRPRVRPGPPSCTAVPDRVECPGASV